MTAPRLFLACFLACSFASVALPANAREGASKLPGISHDPGLRLYSTSSLQHLAARETAGPDTFALFGGPDAGLEGKFETAGGDPDLQGWETVDLTDKEVYWQRSTFNAENLNGNGPGNYAMWCGQDEVQQPSWATAPGYGNDWAQELRWSSPPLADPGQGQTVVLDFYFNADLEAGFDFFEVMFERGGIWETAYTFDSGFVQNQHYGSLGPGVALPIEFQPNTYGGPNNDQIQISLRVVTDGGWSDEDGEFDSNGAVQLDDVSITWSGGVEFEDFEGPGPYLFEPYKQPFFGDWASVITLLTDPDPCRSNISPAVGFIDYGQAPINGPGTTGIVSTGGSTSANINYGVPGHFVVNTTGGLTGLPDFLEINNRIVSPEIE